MFLKTLFLSLVLAVASISGHAQQSFNARAVVSTTGAANHTIVGAVTGKQVSLFGVDVSATASTTLTIKCGSTAVTGAMTLTAYSKPITTPAYFVCPVGTALVFTTTGSADMGGVIWYRQE